MAIPTHTQPVCSVPVSFSCIFVSSSRWSTTSNFGCCMSVTTSSSTHTTSKYPKKELYALVLCSVSWILWFLKQLDFTHVILSTFPRPPDAREHVILRLFRWSEPPSAAPGAANRKALSFHEMLLVRPGAPSSVIFMNLCDQERSSSSVLFSLQLKSTLLRCSVFGSKGTLRGVSLEASQVNSSVETMSGEKNNCAKSLGRHASSTFKLRICLCCWGPHSPERKWKNYVYLFAIRTWSSRGLSARARAVQK